MDWKKRDEHPELFQDGEMLLVAVPREFHWYLTIIAFSCDEGRFEIQEAGLPWDHTWQDVEFWVNITEIEPDRKLLSDLC